MSNVGIEIEKLILENYAGLYTAMGCHKIEIDFSKRKNHICLLVAPNGGGKTTILSALTPFASLGNLDVRDSLPLILLHEKGYKEIHYKKNKDRYIIKHFYTPSKNTHTVKSYIEKNGKELNTNGNVRSFQELVKVELDLELDYLKLIRLGNNVTNLINLKTTDRKNFMSKLLDDTDVYLTYYKKISGDINQIKTVMNHILDKIRKTGIQSLEESMDRREELKDLIEEGKTILKSYEDKMAVIQSKISELPSYTSLVDKVTETSKQLKKISKSLEDNITSASAESDISLIEKQLQKLDLLLGNANTLVTSKYESLNDYYKERDQLGIDISKVKRDSNINSLENIIIDLEYKIQDVEKKFKDVFYPYTKAELEAFIKFIEEQDDFLQAIYSFGQSSIQRVLELQRDHIDVDKYIEKSIKELQNSEFENATRVILQYMKKEFPDEPHCPSNIAGCGYRAFYNALIEAQYKHSEKGKEESITMLQYMDVVNKRLKQFFDKFYNNRSLFEPMCQDIKNMFTINSIMHKIQTHDTIYNREFFFQKLSEITEYENFHDMLVEVENKKAELIVEKKKNYFGYMMERLDTVNRSIEELESSIKELNESIEEYSHDIKDSKEKLLYLQDLKDILAKKDDIERDHDTAVEQMNQLMKLNEGHSSISLQINCARQNVAEKEKEYNYLEFQIGNYESLQKELARYAVIFDEANSIKDAWSTKQGIPLKFIQMHLMGIRDSANDLMDIVYNGRSYIEDFKIDENEFRIPFVTNGVLVSDAAYASQGEESFLSISLSFALTAKNMTTYNIMLLDEIDSALDANNRRNFISVLEKQLERTGAKQCFAITHNNMFDVYPVDILLLKGDKDPNNHLLNYIDIKVS